jgi:hypothetical protein
MLRSETHQEGMSLYGKAHPDLEDKILVVCVSYDGASRGEGDSPSLFSDLKSQLENAYKQKKLSSRYQSPEMSAKKHGAAVSKL